MIKPFKFFIGLILIIFLGLTLRFVDYDRLPPFGKTFDEFHYAWAGLTWITTGTPTTWSWLNSYTNKTSFKRWEQSAPLVSPSLEKPPLFIWLSGFWVWLGGARDIFDVRLSQLRLLPILLASFSILGTGLMASKIFTPQVGLLAAFLYATIPTIVMANRLSLTENLLTPIVLLTFVFALHKESKLNFKNIIVLATGTGLAAMTKQSGVALLISLFIYLATLKKWRGLTIFCAVSLPMVMVFPLIGLMFDWRLYLNVLSELRQLTALSGLPEYVFSIFRFPVLECKECVFLDGTILLGYLLLFTSPLWLTITNISDDKRYSFSGLKKIILVGFPLIYVAINQFINHGSGPIFYGWYQFPLFPFLMIMIAWVFNNLWRSFNFYILILLTLILGTSSIRFLFLFLPKDLYYFWQNVYISLFVLVASTGIFTHINYRKFLLSILLLVFCAINIFTVINLSQIYPTGVQPNP